MLSSCLAFLKMPGNFIWRLWGILTALALSGCVAHADPLARIREAGVLRVALDPSFPPFEYVDESGQAAGFDVDLARELAQYLGVEAHFVTTTYDGLYDALTVGRADVIISGLYPDPTRTQDFTFSRPYFNAGEVLVTTLDSAIAGVSDLTGQRVCVVFGTEGHMTALAWRTRLTPPPELLTRETAADALAALRAGAADAAVVDHVAALGQGAALRVIEPPLTDGRYIIAARRQDSELIRAFDAALITLEAEGVLAELAARWLQGQ